MAFPIPTLVFDALGAIAHRDFRRAAEEAQRYLQVKEAREFIMAMNPDELRVPVDPWITEMQMQWEAAHQPQPQLTATAVMERPTAAPFVLPATLPPDDYLDLSERIKLNQPALVQARLDRFLATEGWPVYDYEGVMAYLQSIANREQQAEVIGEYRGNPWIVAKKIVPFWAPLRPEDAHPSMKQPGKSEMHAATQAKPYTRKVPGHALAKVDVLEKRFGPGPLKFFVSDYQAVTPDPFLMVLAGEGRYVVDVWDEPGW